MARYCVTAALLLGLLTSSGCCWWADRWCPHQQPVAYQGYPPGYGTTCGCPNTSYAPPPNWVPQPAPPVPPQTHTGCTCTCP